MHILINKSGLIKRGGFTPDTIRLKDYSDNQVDLVKNKLSQTCRSIHFYLNYT